MGVIELHEGFNLINQFSHASDGAPTDGVSGNKAEPALDLV